MYYTCNYFQPKYGVSGSECVNNYQLIADMKVTRNQIYRNHSCYSGVKDYHFINKTLQAVKTFVSSHAEI